MFLILHILKGSKTFHCLTVSFFTTNRQFSLLHIIYNEQKAFFFSVIYLGEIFQECNYESKFL